MHANAISDFLSEWKLRDNIIGMCFDTTSVNTGIKEIACVQLERKIGRQLFYFACRHHVLELVVGAAFEKAFQKSKSPDILYRYLKISKQHGDILTSLSSLQFETFFVLSL